MQRCRLMSGVVLGLTVSIGFPVLLGASRPAAANPAALPSGATERTIGEAFVLSLPAQVLGWDGRHLDPDLVDDWLERAAGRSPASARQVALRVVLPGGAERPAGALLPPISSVPDKVPSPGLAPQLPEPGAAVAPPAGPTADLPGPGQGFLTDRAVYLSQCHGWIWYDSLGRFSTQRGNLYDTVEDFHNPEGANHYLVHYLENAGARVYTVRERDPSTAEAIVDDGDPAYSESGTVEAGYRGFEAASGWSYGGGPFDDGSTRRARQSSGARFEWHPTVPEDGLYAVYVSWVPDAENTAAATYTIDHPGGTTVRSFDQRSHGWTWQYVETLWLEAGNSLTVSLAADGAVDDGWVSADAVRIGGGVGNISRYGTTTGRPRWEEGAILQTQYIGAPTTVYDPYGSGDGSDPASRSRWADWEHPTGEDAVYLSWHSNAGGGTGTSTYTYVGSSGSAVAGSEAFAELLQSELVGAFRARWDSDWTDRGHRTAAFSEVNPSHNNETPAALVELAFHDHVSDVEFLKDPVFRQDAARAMYRAVVRYFAERDGTSPVFLPESPEALAVVHDGAGGLHVTWEDGPAGGVLGDAPTAYRLYTSADGRAWDSGVDLSLPEATLHPEAGEAVFVRVTAVNAGGESFPTEVMGGMVSPDDAPPVLVVGAYDRYQITQLVREDVPVLGELRRFHPRRLNPFDGVAAHGRALEATRWPFDSIADENLDWIDLSEYRSVVWMAGEESSTDESVSDEQQDLLAGFVEAGGTLILSGSEVLWDLDALGSDSDRAFALEVLGAVMEADDAGSTTVDGEGLLEGIVLDFGEDAGAPYPNEFPDVPASERTVIARYGSGDPAGVLGQGVAFFGFPLDCVGDEAARADALDALLQELVPDWTWPESGGTDTGSATGGDEGADGDGSSSGDDGATADDDAAGRGGAGAPGTTESLDKGGCATAAAPVGLVGALWGLVAVGRRRRD